MRAITSRTSPIMPSRNASSETPSLHFSKLILEIMSYPFLRSFGNFSIRQLLGAFNNALESAQLTYW